MKDFHFKSFGSSNRMTAVLTILLSYSCISRSTLLHESTENGFAGSKISTTLLDKIPGRIHVHSTTVGRSKRDARPTVWPHSCFRTLRRHSLYECIPVLQALQPQMDPETVTPNTVVPQETVGLSTTLTQRSVSKLPPTPEDPRRNLYALSNATYQFDVPDDVIILRLWHQRIVSVEDFAFKELKKLKVLNLQHNRISYLGVKAFHGLTHLSELELSHNRLHAIPGLTFSELKNLEFLSLQYNELITVENDLFCGLESLSTLDLTYNILEDIGPYAFRHFRPTYIVSVRVEHNRLKIPREEWLMRGPKNPIDPICQPVETKSPGSVMEADSVVTPPLRKVEKPEGIEIEVKSQDSSTDTDGNTHTNKVVLAPVRIFSGAHNPWQCACDTRFRLVRFLRLYKAIIESEFNGGTVEDYNQALRGNEINSTSELFPAAKHPVDFIPKNRTDPKLYFKWYFAMPCDVEDERFSGLDLGKMFSKNYSEIEKSCCSLLPDSEAGGNILKEDKTLGNLCRPDEEDGGGLSENHVTIIGIVIVFSTPILLTLCPDCNRTVAPSSGGGMVSGGKFGAMSLNNNNNGRRYSWKNDRTPFNNDRFCLVLQTEKKPSRTHHVEGACIATSETS